MKSTFISDNQAATVVKPGETSFDALPLGVTCRRKTRRLSALSAPFVFALRDAHLDSARRQLAPEGGAVKSFVGDQLLHSGSGSSSFLFFDGDGRQCAARQTNFVRLPALAKQTDGKSVAVRHEHHFAALAHFGPPDSIAPFFDGTNELSRKAAAHSILPSRSSNASSALQTESQTSVCDHSSNRRQQVVGEPYSLGKSAHATPVFRTYKMPFKHLRLSVRGHPRPVFGCGKSSSSTCHCASVKSCRLIMPTILTQTL